MATHYRLHPDNPQPQRIEEIRGALRSGAVMLYPTDTVYAIGCDLNVKSAVQRVRHIKQFSNDKPLTFLCSSLSDISQYAYVTDAAYRVVKRLIPGPFTFLLPATKLVPRLVMAPKRKTTGIRVPNNRICMELLEALGNPVISTSATTPFNPDDTRVSQAELFDQFDHLVDLIIDDDQPVGHEYSTIIDLRNDPPLIVRKGLGWDKAVDWAEIAPNEPVLGLS
ncbi:MAG: L-threonylcarbamoyladenylate synthase [Cyanobacteria bacterium P01_A01_bin.37]